MRFSILLPTRNRLDLLRYAVETVRRQDFGDWEVIVSDNCSEEDVHGFVCSLNDPRIKYVRTEGFLPVTENWNNALYKSSGEYVIMLGDDDGLMKGALTTLDDLIQKFHSPDFIYMRTFLYAYPGVVPGLPDGLLRVNGCARFFEHSDEPFILDPKAAVRLVKQSMRFRLAFEYNMQYSVIRRAFIDSLGRGPFFQSPYPDYYASNVLFLKADRILICPLPLATVGISPKSFGFFYYNDREEQGVQFLKNVSDPALVEKLKDVLLPGTNMNDSWLLAMETICANFGEESGLRVDYGRYRTIQVLHAYRRCIQSGGVDRRLLDEIWGRLTLWERLSYKLRLSLLSFLEQHVKGELLESIRRLIRMEGPYPDFNPYRCPRRFENILEVFEAIEPAHGLSFARKR